MLSLVIVKLKSIINCNNINWLQANLSKQRRNHQNSRDFAHFKHSTASFACRKAPVQACWWPWRSGSKTCQNRSISHGNGMKSSRRATITNDFRSIEILRETSRNQPRPTPGAQDRTCVLFADSRSIQRTVAQEPTTSVRGETERTRKASARV